MGLDVVKENLRFRIGGLEHQLAQGRIDVSQRRGALFDLAQARHLLAVAILLTDADRPRFFSHLVSAASARKELLQLSRSQALAPDRFTAASQFVPLLDAFVAGEQALAEEIVALSPSKWVEGYEYEDDFRYALVLHAFIRDGSRPSAEHERLTADFEAALDGVETARLPALRALLARDSPAFDAALQALVTEWERQRDEEIDAAVAKTERHLTEKYFFVEGLALLRLAEAAGLEVGGRYRYIPDLVRRSEGAP